MDKYLNIDGVLDLLGVSRATFYAKLRADAPEHRAGFPWPAILPGRRGFWWDAAAVRAWLKGSYYSARMGLPKKRKGR